MDSSARKCSCFEEFSVADPDDRAAAKQQSGDDQDPESLPKSNRGQLEQLGKRDVPQTHQESGSEKEERCQNERDKEDA